MRGSRGGSQSAAVDGASIWRIAAQNATRGPQWWAMSVLVMIMIAPVVVMAVALERDICRGLLVGALKG